MNKNVIDYLLEQVSTEFGIVDLKNPAQYSYLYNMLLDYEIPVYMIQESISKLVENDSDKEKKAAIAKKKKLKSIGWNNYEDSAGNKFTWNDERQDIIPAADDDSKQQSGDNETDSTGKTADLSTMATPPVAWYRMGD